MKKKKLADQAHQMELDDTLQREQKLLKKLEEADEEDKKSTSTNYFERTKGSARETAFDDMKGENLADVSTMILKKAKKSFFSGLLPDF